MFLVLVKRGRRSTDGDQGEHVSATSTPSTRRRNLIKRLLAVRWGLSTFRHLADTGTRSLTSLHAYRKSMRRMLSAFSKRLVISLLFVRFA